MQRQGTEPRHGPSIFLLLDEMILEEKYDDAINLLESFKDIDPLETGKRLVSLYRQINEQDRVVTELVSLGDLFASRDLKKEALNCYREAISVSPDDDRLKSKVMEFEKTRKRVLLP